jgi:hypothetical protein
VEGQTADDDLQRKYRGTGDWAVCGIKTSNRGVRRRSGGSHTLKGYRHKRANVWLAGSGCFGE